MTKFSNKLKKPFLAHFRPFFTILGQKKLFPENPALSRTNLYEFLAPCQISEKTNDAIPRKRLDRRTDGRTERRTDPILQDTYGYHRGSKNENYHQILHIQINLDSKFQLQETILISGTNLQNEVYFQLKTEKNEHHY